MKWLTPSLIAIILFSGCILPRGNIPSVEEYVKENTDFRFRYVMCSATSNSIDVILENTGRNVINPGPVVLVILDYEDNESESIKDADALKTGFMTDTFLNLNFNASNITTNKEYILNLTLPGITKNQTCVAQ